MASSLETQPAAPQRTGRPTDVASEARLLLLIAAFSHEERGLEGRTKLAKLDFLLRYPNFFRRAMQRKTQNPDILPDEDENAQIESRMVRYRYGPWDPSYFIVLGRLIGRGLIQVVPYKGALAFRATPQGRLIAMQLAENTAWATFALKAELLYGHFGEHDGEYLKRFVYDNFPEVTSAEWREPL